MTICSETIVNAFCRFCLWYLEEEKIYWVPSVMVLTFVEVLLWVWVGYSYEAEKFSWLVNCWIWFSAGFALPVLLLDVEGRCCCLYISLWFLSCVVVAGLSFAGGFMQLVRFGVSICRFLLQLVLLSFSSCCVCALFALSCFAVCELATTCRLRFTFFTLCLDRRFVRNIW